MSNQRKYILELISEERLAGAKICDTPVEQGIKFTSKEFDDSAVKYTDDDPLLDDAGEYMRLIGRLIYITVTRPDICYVVQTLSQFMNIPKDHIQRQQ